MMHHQSYSFIMCVSIQLFNIKIRIRSHKIKNIIFLISKPIFPTNIPSFYQQLIESMFRSKINILLHISCISRMITIRFYFPIIRFSKLHGRNIISIAPWLPSSNHLPPYPHIFYRLNPRSILNFTWLIQIQNQMR